MRVAICLYAIAGVIISIVGIALGIVLRLLINFWAAERSQQRLELIFSN